MINKINFDKKYDFYPAAGVVESLALHIRWMQLNEVSLLACASNEVTQTYNTLGLAYEAVIGALHHGIKILIIDKQNSDRVANLINDTEAKNTISVAHALEDCVRELFVGRQMQRYLEYKECGDSDEKLFEIYRSLKANNSIYGIIGYYGPKGQLNWTIVPCM